VYGVVGCGVRVGGNDGNPKKAESHLRRSESTQGAPGVQGGLFGVQEGAVGSQEVAGKWRCMNDFPQKVEDFSRFLKLDLFDQSVGGAGPVSLRGAQNRSFRRKRTRGSGFPTTPGKSDDFPDQVSASDCGNGNERREKVYLVECERSGPHLEIPYLFY